MILASKKISLVAFAGLILSINACSDKSQDKRNSASRSSSAEATDESYVSNSDSTTEDANSSAADGSGTSAAQEDIVDNPEAEASQDEEAFVRSSPCQTRYPILLVHGVGGRDIDKAGDNYFNRIPEHLIKNCNIEVFQGGQDAFSSSEVNALQLREKILQITDELGYKKVNIIAHSKGGLDIRSMFFQSKGQSISGRTMNERVASFTTISTPHRGSLLADFLLARIGENSQDLLATFIDMFGKKNGDSEAIDSEAALTQLSTDSMLVLNAQFGDLETGIDGVYCQSWISDMSVLNQNVSLFATSKIIDSLGFDVNDGAVHEASAIYGNYRGVLGKDIVGGISHTGIVDRPGGLGLDAGFDALDFYGDMLTELGDMGF